MANKIVFVGNRRGSFNFRRRALGPGFLLINRSGMAVYILSTAKLRKSMVYGAVIHQPHSVVEMVDKIFSTHESIPLEMNNPFFQGTFQSVKSGDKRNAR